MDSFFTQLGRTVSARWQAANFSLERFPEIACAALEERPPAENVELSALLRAFLLEDEQPFQTASGFGQPELVVYDNPRFYIQILFWLDGTTDIHQHKFSGAFHVLAGSSIHSRFQFENAESVTAHMRVGDLRMIETHLLETGSTAPIVSGRGYIHSLFHLETPSATVVIRTHTDPGTGPQFTYLPPHLAVDPFHHDALTTRRKQLLDMIEQVEDSAYPDLVREMIGMLDFERGFFVLQNCIGHLRSVGEWDALWKIFRAKHGRLADFAAPTLDEIIRRDALSALRGAVSEVGHRFFLALLLNVPSRVEILKFIGQRYDGEPTETVVRWLEELCQQSDFSTWILDAEFPEALEIPVDEQPEIFLTVLKSLMNNPAKPPGADSRVLTSAELAQLRESFLHSSLRVLIS